MDYKKKDLQNKQGLVQSQTQRNEQHKRNGEQKWNSEFGIISAPKAQESDVNLENKEVSLEAINDENIVSEIKAKRRPWNSITFDRDDFFSGLAQV